MLESASSFQIVNRQHPSRAEVEVFIAQVFFENYKAQIQYFAENLLAWRDASGQLKAALGYTPAQQNRLFVENYTHQPIDQTIAAFLQVPFMRKSLVEVGNLAAIEAGAARQLIAHAIVFLYQQGFSWVVFTATRGLLNSFARLKIKSLELGKASPHNLPDQGATWGTYFDTQPSIMTGSIALAYMALTASAGRIENQNKTFTVNIELPNYV